MTSYIQNYGFTKTLLKDKNNTLQNEIQWQGDYDGKMANIDVNINDNGNKQAINVQLDNNDIRQLFGIQPIEVPLEKRLANDFLYNPNRILLHRIPLQGIALQGAPFKTIKRRKNKKRTNRRNNKRRTNKRKTNRRIKSIINPFFIK